MVDDCNKIYTVSDSTNPSKPKETVLEEPFSLDKIPDIYLGDESMMEEYFNEIRRRTLALLMNDGENVKLLVRRTSGDRCPYWSDEMQQCPKPLNPETLCYNTGWIGGYIPPIDIKIRFVPAGQTVTIYENGLRREFEPRSWTIWTPFLHDRDVIVTAQNKRYEVLNVTKVPLWRGLITRQEFSLKEVLPDDPVMQISVNPPDDN